MASALRRRAVLVRLVANARKPSRRRSAQTPTGRRMARAVHRHRSVRCLGGGPRRRLRRRLNASASMPLIYGPRAEPYVDGANGRRKRRGNASARQRPRLRPRCLPGEGRSGVLAGRHESGRQQAPRRLPQSRQSTPARRSRQTAARSTTLRCPSLATSGWRGRGTRGTCFRSLACASSVSDWPPVTRSDGRGLHGRAAGTPASMSLRRGESLSLRCLTRTSQEKE